MEFHVAVEFKFKAMGDAENIVDLYDVSQALIGFQRSLALTTHLFLNNKIIVQAPHLKGAQILTGPVKEGSWEIIGLLGTLGTGLIMLNQQPRDTPLGHLWHSAYDYVVNEILGFHVDYDKTLGRQIEEYKRDKIVNEITLEALKRERLDTLCEKCESAIKMMHRPIYASKSATSASLTARFHSGNRPISKRFDILTYKNLGIHKFADEIQSYKGKISSYNSNTYTGRIFVEEIDRLVPFELHSESHSAEIISKITSNLHFNANREIDAEWLKIECKLFLSRTGMIKKLLILDVSYHDGDS